jgi:hypothetical protein
MSYKEGDECTSEDTYDGIEDALSYWVEGMPIGHLTFTTDALDIQTILRYLPQGGPATSIIGLTKTQMTGRGPKNSLLSQTITFGLNIGLNPGLLAFQIPVGVNWLMTTGTSNCGSIVDGINECFRFEATAAMDKNGDGYVSGQELWDLAQAGLKGQSTNGVKLSDIVNLEDAIANAFDECRSPADWFDYNKCAEDLLTGGYLFTNMPDRPGAAAATEIKVKAWPNPFTDRVFIRFTPPVTGKAVVEIYDMTGRKLEQINKGTVQAGRETMVEYFVPSQNRNSIIYRITVDKYSANGRLISPGINR